MCLTGVDYFSTLAYQPSIAFDNAGVLAPLATVVLVLVTLFGALPVYSFVAGKSPHGQGSVGMLEHLLKGWSGKLLVLVLLGFAGTDFVITKTLSAADAAAHVIANPIWPLHTEEPDRASMSESEYSLRHAEHENKLTRERMALTILFLVLLGVVFLRGFREAIGIAVVLTALYLLLNLVVVGAGLYHLATHPGHLPAWWHRVTTGEWHIEHSPFRLVGGADGWTVAVTIIGVALLLFPKLALGLSGFETGVAVMPLIKGDAGDTEREPVGRIRNARKLLLTAALIMSCFLLTSSLVVSTLIPPAELERPLGKAVDRALAFLAHAEGPDPIFPRALGPWFGTVYDLSTVVILWFAGASAMAGLLNLVPQYLPRYGMAPEWARHIRALVILFTFINLLVTWIFDASVEAQGGAYATGVLVLISSACFASVIQSSRERTGPLIFRIPWGYTFIGLVFLYTTITVIIEKPDGIKIAACFIATIVTTSLVSRARRSMELRFAGFRFPDADSRFRWESVKALEVSVLVPHRPGRRGLEHKEATIRRDHRLGTDVPIIFLEVSLADASEFNQQPSLEVLTDENSRVILRITQAASIAHTIAAVALELAKVGKPPEIHFGWTDETPLAGTLGFLLFGEGNVPWMVHELIKKAEPDISRRPPVIIGGL
jgi:hypothetical protein